MYPQGLDFGGTRHFLRVHTFKCIIIFFNLPPTVVCHFYCVMYMHCDCDCASRSKGLSKCIDYPSHKYFNFSDNQFLHYLLLIKER